MPTKSTSDVLPLARICFAVSQPVLAAKSTCLNHLYLLQAGQDPWPYPSVHAPWYGYLFWTLASAGGYGKAADTSFVAANVERWDKCAANIKVGRRAGVAGCCGAEAVHQVFVTGMSAVQNALQTLAGESACCPPTCC